MTTVADLTARLSRKLRGVVPQGEFTTTTEALDATETGVDVTSAADFVALVAGAIVEIDHELMLVQSVATNTLTVVRGWDGTAAAAHASGAIVKVNPKWSDLLLVEEMKAEVRSWDPQIYAISRDALTWPAYTNWLDATVAVSTSNPALENVLGILDAIRVPGQTEGPVRQVPMTLWRGFSNHDDGVFFVLDNSLVFDTPASLMITAAVSHDISEWPGEADFDPSGDGWGAVWYDVFTENLLMWGAGVRVLAGMVFNRADLSRQGQSRHAEEVSAQELELAIQMWKAQRNEAFATEVRRLAALYPIRMG